MLGVAGLISIFISMGIFIYALVSYIFHLNQLTAGWTSLMITITFLGGIQLLSIWLISEYVGKIYDESKGRPEYIIDKKMNIE